MNKRGTRVLNSVINQKICPSSKRSQITIFIILGVIIIAAIGVFLIFGADIRERIGISGETNPESFLDSCIEDKVQEGIKIISMQGGSVSNPLNKSFLFEDEKSPIDISYLCYNQNDNFPCVNQEPMLFQHLEDEIKNYISDEVTDCFNDLAASLENQGYSVQKPELRSFEVKLQSKRVIIETDSEITLTKAGETSKQEDFKIIIPSRLYEIAEVVLEIVNKEATVCEFSHYDKLNYQKFDINTYKTSDASVIHTVKHEDSNEEFRFAVRGCVIPPGFGLTFQ